MNFETTSRKFRVLLVDDDENDRVGFRTALKKSGLDVDLFEATDGCAGINYLAGHGPYSNRAKFPLPDMIFLDLKMLGMDGFDVLKEIRTGMGLQNLPVIVLTSSTLNLDTIAAYSLGASAFHKKPSNYQGFGRSAAKRNSSMGQ